MPWMRTKFDRLQFVVIRELPHKASSGGTSKGLEPRGCGGLRSQIPYLHWISEPYTLIFGYLNPQTKTITDKALRFAKHGLKIRGNPVEVGAHKASRFARRPVKTASRPVTSHTQKLPVAALHMAGH